MPSDKRARQRAAREAKLAAQARADKRRRTYRNAIVAGIVGLAVVGSIYLITRGSSSPKHSTASSSSTTKAGSPPTTKAGGTTTTTPGTTATTATSGANAALQSAANAAAVAAGCPASPTTRANTLTFKSAPPMTIDTAKTYTATVDTTAGTFVITLDAKKTPQTVNNFVFLSQKSFFHCVIFHRVIPGFMDQTGDPTGTGTGGPGYTIPDEYPPKAANPANQYPLGSVAMANTGQPHSGGSQWFIVSGSAGESLPNTYSLFGTVTSGMSVVQKINAEGNANPSANGVPPDVVQRILSVTIHSS